MANKRKPKTSDENMEISDDILMNRFKDKYGL